MISEFTTFDKSTGVIISTGVAYVEMQPLESWVGRLLLRSDVLTQYVRNNKVLDRPVFSIEVDAGSVTSIPLGTKIFVDGTLIVERSTEATLTFEKPNPLDFYQLKFVNFPYMDFEVTL